MNVRSLLITAVFAAVVPVGFSAPAHAAATACGDASYGSSAPIESTNYGVRDIKAKNTSCGTAKKVALASEDHSSERYRKAGFGCAPKASHGGERPYVCTKKNKQGDVVAKVTFSTVGAG